MNVQDDELPAVARRILGEYREVRGMPPAAFDRVGRRLSRPVGASWRLGLIAAAAAAITVAVLSAIGSSRAVGVGAEVDRTQASHESRTTAAHGDVVPPGGSDTDAAEIPTVAPAPTIEAPSPPSDAAPVDAVAPRPSPRPTPKPEVTTPPPMSTLTEERALMQQAQRALADGDDERVAAIVREHARRFPAGSLRPEFAAISTMQRCRDPGQSRAALLEAFVAAHGDSPLLAAVRQVCAPR